MGVYKRGKKYWISYSFQKQQIRELGGLTEREAEKALMVRQTEIMQGRFDIKKVKPSVLFEDFCRDYIDHVRSYKKSWKRDVGIIKGFQPYFRGKRLDDISAWSIEKYKSDRCKGVQPATVNRELACLKHMFSRAIEWKKALENPVKKVDPYRIDEKNPRYLSEEEIPKLIDSCEGYLKDIVITALTTGMRAGEIFSLRWQDVNLQHRFIAVEKTKSKKTRRIPINEYLLNIFTGRKKYITGPFVFPNRDGKPIGSVKRSFRSALTRAGIKNFRFHDLRHTFASHLVLNDVHLITVKELLGHSSIKQTMIYAHLPERRKREAVDHLDFQNYHNLITIEKSEKASSA